MPQFNPEEALHKLTILLTNKQWEWLHKSSFTTRKSKSKIIRDLITKAMKGGE